MNMRLASEATSRKKVVADARRLSLKHPYEVMTLRKVAAEAGSSTGSIFAAFSGKEELWVWLQAGQLRRLRLPTTEAWR